MIQIHHEISDLRIGETPLSDFEGVEVETRQGYPGDAPLTLYSDSVLQNSSKAASSSERNTVKESFLCAAAREPLEISLGPDGQGRRSSR